MALRAALLGLALPALALLLGLVPAGAAERAPSHGRRPRFRPIFSDRLGCPARRRCRAHAARVRPVAHDRDRGVHARRPLSGRDRPAAAHLPAPAAHGRAGARADQGVPLRPGDAGRLAHRDRRAGPVRIDKAFVLESVDGQPARLVLDLVATDRESFMRTLALEGTAAPRAGKPSRRSRPSAPNDGRGR